MTTHPACACRRAAGIALAGRRSYSDLSPFEAGRLAAAAAAGQIPLDMVVHVRAENPRENNVTARLIQLDWTLFLESTRTVSGGLAKPCAFPPGEAVDVPVDVHLDLMEFFRNSARDAFDLALAIAGYGGAAKEVRLEALPAIETSLGPIRYPEPIVIRRVVGSR